MQSCYASGIMIGTSASKISNHDNIFENARASGASFYLVGVNGNFYNNYVWGNAMNTNGAIVLAQCVNPRRIENNTINNCVVGFSLGAYTSLGCVDEDSTFGDETVNTTDILWEVAAGPDYTFKNTTVPVGGLVHDETYREEMIVGTKLAFEDYGGTSNFDKTIYTYGKVQRTGDGLTDTTVRTSGTGKFAMRFQPLSEVDTFDFDFDVPTGNIQNKTMAISVWVKINSATYYAGTHQNPIMTITYDTDQTATATAADSTGWQLLSVVFTPTTTVGKVTVTLSCATDASDSDAYIYFDDFSVLYPAGVQLNLGGLDVWSGGLPVLPPISTSASALDVWGVSKSTDFGSGSIGEQVSKKLLDTNKFIALK
jgi:hypothetical protein